ncbi:hypothetical protein [Butyrivibrio proteoclasticus]|uniref:hypothetical protein n=1 Tax=Butyrivibrio proteoclasticus TaxID=43305 RepID=UPI0004787742|nr:hypothetical protein [Butyrivibrio proteoclasticus]
MNDNWQNEQLRIQDMINKGYKYDPVTGQPLEQMTKMYSAQHNTAVSTAQGTIDKSQGKKKTNKAALYIATFGGVTMLLIALTIGHIVSNLVKYADKDKPKFYVENSIDEDYFEKYTPSDDSEYDKKDIDLSYFSSFSINGNTYELPGKVQDYINSDWVFNNDNDMDTVLGYGESTTVYLHVPGTVSDNTISFGVTNFSLDAMPIKDCYITSVEFYEVDGSRKGNEISICDGKIVLCQTSEEEVLETLGDPYHAFDMSQSVAYTYRYESDYDMYSEMTIHIDKQNDRVQIISVRNRITPEDFEQVEVTDYVPEYLSGYEAPGTLGDDMLSGNIQIQDVVYNLPAPISVFIENGWEPYNSEDVGALIEKVVTLKKGGDSLTVTVQNNSEKAVHLENTMVTGVSLSCSSRYNLDAKMPGGLTLTMSDKEIASCLEKNGITNYEHRKDTRMYKIPFDQSSSADDYGNILIIYVNSDGQMDTLSIHKRG